MYSNNIITSNNVGVCWVANAGGVVGDHGGDYEGSCSRKEKKPRIPKRGPGVAELEKILREQGKRNGIGGISSPLVPSNSLPRNFTYLRNTPRPTRPSPITPPLPPMMPLHVNGNGDLKGSSQLGGGNVVGNGGSKGVYIGGSGIYLPEKALLPVTWDFPDSETKNSEEPPKMASDFSIPRLASNRSDHSKMLPPPTLPTNGPCHPSMIGRNEFKQMNLFPGSSATSSSSTPSLSASSTGVYHHGEPPSNQKSCHNNTSKILAKEDKIIGAKRSRPDFPVYSWPPAPPPIPCQPPPLHHQISRLVPSSSSSNNAVGVLNLGKISRDLMPSKPLELKVKACVNDHGNPSGNASDLTSGSPTTPLPSTQNYRPDLSKFIKHFPFQEMKEKTEEGSEEQRGASATADAKLGSETEKYRTEKSGDFIDLNLKL